MSGAECFAVKHLTAGGVMIKINNIWQTGKISKYKWIKSVKMNASTTDYTSGCVRYQY